MRVVYLVLYFSLGIIFLTGCTQKVEKTSIPPDDLIARDEMVNIIVDMHIYDAIMMINQKKSKKPRESKYFYYKSVMKKHNITREKFERNIEHYQQNLDEMDDIYADAITKLSKMHSEAQRD